MTFDKVHENHDWIYFIIILQPFIGTSLIIDKSLTLQILGIFLIVTCWIPILIHMLIRDYNYLKK